MLTDSKSTGSLQGGPGMGGPGLGVLLAPLKELLEAATLQQEAMREIVAAVGDADKGKQGALNALLQQRQHLRVGREEGERLRAEAAELREENARLKARLRAYEGGGGDGARRPAATSSADELA